MTKVELNVFFKMQQKDDKKEVLKFEIKGNDEENSTKDLHLWAGNIVSFSIDGCDAGETTAEFMNIQRDSKKTAIKFAIKGDSEEKAQELYKFAGRNVKLAVQPSQMSIEEFNEQHEGIEYSVDKDGTTKISPDQISIDDVDSEEDQENQPEKVEEKLPFADDAGDFEDDPFGADFKDEDQLD